MVSHDPAEESPTGNPFPVADLMFGTLVTDYGGKNLNSFGATDAMNPV